MQLGITDEQLGIVRRSNWFCTLYVLRQVGHYANRLVGWVCRSSMGARCFPGLVVLSLSPIVNTISLEVLA